MAKGDVYYLISPDKTVCAKFEQNDDYMSGNCYEATSWGISDDSEIIDGVYEWGFVCKVYCKWDACTHWYFYGEDYDAENDKEHDSYYHLCGSHFLVNHIRIMCFLWKLAPFIIAEDTHYMKNDINVDEEYFDSNEIRLLIDTMLDGYEIVKAKMDGGKAG